MRVILKQRDVGEETPIFLEVAVLQDQILKGVDSDAKGFSRKKKLQEREAFATNVMVSGVTLYV